MKENNEDLINVLERFSDGLVARATGGTMQESDYVNDRKFLLGSIIKEKLPKYIFSCRSIDDFWIFIKFKYAHYDERRSFLRNDFNEIINDLEMPPTSATKIDFAEKASSIYIKTQVQLMIEMQKNNPTEAIGKAKELIESCCKTILTEKEIIFDSNDDINDLIKKVLEDLRLTPDYISDDIALSKTLKQILGNLRAISTGIAELRNQYGGGHGKDSNYKGLQERHAKLAVGSASTLVNFLWDSFELQKNN